jgi:NADP-dependent 3-hydroxy acid dehydrogenase YdfG
VAKEKVCFITGCSTGFEREIAKTAISAGYTVVATARSRDAITDLTGRSWHNKEKIEWAMIKRENSLLWKKPAPN